MLRLATIFLTAMTLAAVSLGFGVNSALAGGGGGHGCMKAPSESEATTVAIREGCFETTLLRVQPGTTVTFYNHDPAPHNVYSFDNEVLIREQDLEAGEQAQIRVNEAGILGYYCTIHPSMVGIIVSGDTADAAVLADLRTRGGELKVDPPKVDVERESGSLPAGAVAGIAIAVGLVSAGGGFAVRRRS